MNRQIFLPSRLNFNLCNPKSAKATIIYAVVYFGGRQYKVNTGVKVIPSQWDKRKQCAIISTRLNNLHKSNNQVANNKLYEISSRFNSFLNYICQYPEEIEDFYNIFKRQINNKMGTRKRKNTKATFEKDFADIAYTFTDERQTKYVRITKDIIAYMKANNIVMEWDSVNKDMLHHYLIKAVENNNYEHRTFKDKVNDMYAILRHADNEGYLADFDEKRWRKTLDCPIDPRTRAERQTVYNILEKEEIAKLANTDFDTPIKNEVRDIFVFLCYTGLAVGDLLQLLDEEKITWIDENNIQIRRNKTGQTATIPLHHVKRYYENFKKNGFPYTKIKGKKQNDKIKLTSNENSRINKILKEIIKDSGLDRDIKVTRSNVQVINGKIVAKKEQTNTMMSDEITMYDSRHTFITVAYYDKMPKEQIKDIAGHTNTKMLDEIYLKLNEEKEAIAKAERNNKFYNIEQPHTEQPQQNNNNNNEVWQHYEAKLKENFKLEEKIEQQQRKNESNKMMLSIAEQKSRIAQENCKNLVSAVKMGFGKEYIEAGEESDAIDEAINIYNEPWD
jgi:hypothetical protein